MSSNRNSSLIHGDNESLFRRSRSLWRTILLNVCVGLLPFIGGSTFMVIGALFTALQRAFQLHDTTSIGVLISANAVAATVGTVVFGPWVDKFGVNKVALVILLLALLGNSLTAVASSLEISDDSTRDRAYALLFVSRVIHGLGNGPGLLGAVYLTRFFVGSPQFSLMVALNAVATETGYGLALLVFSAISERFGVTTALWANAAVVAVAMCAWALVVVPEERAVARATNRRKEVRQWIEERGLRRAKSGRHPPRFGGPAAGQGQERALMSAVSFRIGTSFPSVSSRQRLGSESSSSSSTRAISTVTVPGAISEPPVGQITRAPGAPGAAVAALTMATNLARLTTSSDATSSTDTQHQSTYDPGDGDTAANQQWWKRWSRRVFGWFRSVGQLSAVFWLATLVFFASRAVNAGVGGFGEPILAEFGWGAAAAGALLSVIGLSPAVLATPVGFCFDKFGHRSTALVVAGVLAAVGLSLLQSQWGAPPQLSLVLVALAQPVVLVGSRAIVPLVVSESQWGTAFGLNIGIGSGAALFVPLVVAPLKDTTGNFAASVWFLASLGVLMLIAAVSLKYLNFVRQLGIDLPSAKVSSVQRAMQTQSTRKENTSLLDFISDTAARVDHCQQLKSSEIQVVQENTKQVRLRRSSGRTKRRKKRCSKSRDR